MDWTCFSGDPGAKNSFYFSKGLLIFFYKIKTQLCSKDHVLELYLLFVFREVVTNPGKAKEEEWRTPLVTNLSIWAFIRVSPTSLLCTQPEVSA